MKLTLLIFSKYGLQNINKELQKVKQNLIDSKHSVLTIHGFYQRL